MSSDVIQLHILAHVIYTRHSIIRFTFSNSELRYYKTKATTDNYMIFIYPFRQTFLMRCMNLNPVPLINLKFGKVDSSLYYVNFCKPIAVLEMVAFLVVLELNSKLNCLCFREASFRRAFNEFDTDGSGYIDNAELMVIISYLFRFFAIRNSTRFGRLSVIFRNAESLNFIDKDCFT